LLITYLLTFLLSVLSVVLTGISNELNDLMMSTGRRQAHRNERQVRVDDQTDAERVFATGSDVIAAVGEGGGSATLGHDLDLSLNGPLVPDVGHAADVLKVHGVLSVHGLGHASHLQTDDWFNRFDMMQYDRRMERQYCFTRIAL